MSIWTIDTKQNTEQAHAYFRNKNDYTTGPVEVSAMIKDRQGNVQIVDVRAEEDFRKEHVPGALSLPKGQWEQAAGLRKDKINILYCYNQQCHLAAKAAMYLAGEGYPVMEMEGGFEAWQERGLPVENGGTF